jgi:hypothetical protein
MSHAATAGQANGTFQLERFEWAAPDRLEIAGSFAGVEPPRAAPTLLVRADDGVRRLTGATADEAGDGDPWSAAFHWREPPVPFSAAELDLGGGLSVVLPAPGASAEALSIRGAASPAADTLRLQAELIAAQEETREAQAAHELALEELERARADLEAMRLRRTAEAERFKEGLAQVREAGERALATSQGELEALRARVGELEDQLAAVPPLEERLDRAVSDAEEARRSLEEATAEQAALREALDRARQETEEARATLTRAQAEADQAEALQARLDAVRRALDDDPP